MKIVGQESNDHPLLEALLENAEAGIDLITNNEVVAAIPIVGTVLKVFRGMHDVHARLLIAKVTRFVNDPSLQSEEAKAALAQMAHEGTKESRKIGETLFLVLERLIDMDKPALLAQVFAGYLANRIDREELLRLAPAIDAAYIEDIHKLISAREHVDANESMWMQPLVFSGLVEQGVPGPVGGKLTYRVTTLGRALRKAVTEE